MTLFNTDFDTGRIIPKVIGFFNLHNNERLIISLLPDGVHYYIDGKIDKNKWPLKKSDDDLIYQGNHHLGRLLSSAESKVTPVIRVEIDDHFITKEQEIVFVGPANIFKVSN